MRSFPWDSIVEAMGDDGYPIYDRAYTASDLQEVYRTFFSNGVFGDVADEFQVLSGDGMSVNVQPGKCHINGVVGFERSARNLVVQASTTQGRYDTVVLRFNANLESRSIDLYVKQGTAAATPVRPALTRSDTVWELGLCDILVTANSTSVAQERITDTRLDANRCGIVAPFERLDTTTFYNQLQAALDKQVGELQEQTDKAVELANAALDGTVVGELQTQIDDKVGLGSGETKLDSADIGGFFDQSSKLFQLVGHQGGIDAQLNISGDGAATFFDGIEGDGILWQANIALAIQSYKGEIIPSLSPTNLLVYEPGIYDVASGSTSDQPKSSPGDGLAIIGAANSVKPFAIVAYNDGTVYISRGYVSGSNTSYFGWSRLDNGAINLSTITGTLAVAKGGTGLTSSPSMLTNLGSTSAANVLQASPRPGITGTLSVGHGGTGATTVAGARNALGLGNTSGAVPVANGGTGATTAANARSNMGISGSSGISPWNSTWSMTVGACKMCCGKIQIDSVPARSYALRQVSVPTGFFKSGFLVWLTETVDRYDQPDAGLMNYMAVNMNASTSSWQLEVTNGFGYAAVARCAWLAIGC